MADWDKYRAKAKELYESKLRAIIEKEKLRERKDLFSLYQEAGSALAENAYDDEEDRRYDIDLRRAILLIDPGIRFDPNTGKLRDQPAKKFNIVVNDTRNNRFVCFSHSKDTPTVFPYPYITDTVRVNSPRGLLAYLAQNRMISEKTILIQSMDMTTYDEFLRHYASGGQ